MALQSFEAPSSSGTGTATSTSTATNTPPPDNTNALTPGSSIPFSFLIAFIALFLFFLGCGLGTRRAAVVLRRNLGLNDPSTVGSKRREATRPVIWDAWPEIDERNTCEKWETLQPLSATYVREKSDEEEEALPSTTPVAPSPIAAFPRPPILPLPYDAVRPVGGLGYFPARSGGIITIHPPASIPNSPRPTSSSPRLSPAAVPLTPYTRPPPTPPPPANPPAATTTSPQPHVGFVGRIRNTLRNHVYTVAILNELGVTQRRPRNEVKEVPLKPVEGLQVTVLVAMPSLERKLRAKLKRESSDVGQAPPSAKGKEVVAVADDPPEISAEYGELVIGTMKVSWDDEKLGDGD